jgi:hypothetical protein
LLYKLLRCRQADATIVASDDSHFALALILPLFWNDCPRIMTKN